MEITYSDSEKCATIFVLMESLNWHKVSDFDNRWMRDYYKLWLDTNSESPIDSLIDDQWEQYFTDGILYGDEIIKPSPEEKKWLKGE